MNDLNTSSSIHSIPPCLLVIMGVSGTGKTKLAKNLHQSLGWPYQEGDALHSIENIQKMASGIPLTDQDRLPWLEKCHTWLQNCVEHNDGKGILTCSALKHQYRDILRKNIQSPLYFICLQVPKDIVAFRLEKRQNHFMPVSLLNSQIDTLELPTPDENVIFIDTRHDPAETLEETLKRLSQR